MTVQEVLGLLGLLVAVAGAAATVWWRLAAKLSQASAELHARINKTRDEYMRRDDVMQHFTRIEAGQAATLTAMTAGFERVNQRIDHLTDRRGAGGEKE